MNKFIFKEKDLIFNNISLILIIPLLLYKSIIFIKEPRIWAEEGAVYLQSVLNNGFISIFQSHQGYFSSIPNVTLYVSTLFNYKYIPYFTFIVSFIFWIILFIVINNINGLFKKKYLLKFYLSIGIFFILNYYQEIFMNTINLQFITPLILFGITLYDFRSLNNFTLFLFFILSLICLTNGVLGIFFLPLILYNFFSLKKYTYIILILFTCLTTYFIIPYFTPETSNSFGIITRIKNNIHNFSLKRGFINFLVRFISLFSIVFFLINIRLKKWFLSYIFLLISSLIIFIDLTKYNSFGFSYRYLSLIFSLFYMIIFIYINSVFYNKNIFTLIFVFCTLFFARTFFANDYSYCNECNKWSDEYIKLYNHNDANIHPLGWKVVK